MSLIEYQSLQSACALLVLICLGGAGLYAYMQGLGDLRTETAKSQGASDASQRLGRALLARSLERLGGAERWKETFNQCRQ